MRKVSLYASLALVLSSTSTLDAYARLASSNRSTHNKGHTEPQKTFYPESWCRKKIIEKTFEALNNLVEPPICEENGIVFFGKTTEEIVLKIVTTKHGELITAFLDALKNTLY